MKIRFAGNIFDSFGVIGGICELADTYGYIPCFCDDEKCDITVRLSVGKCDNIDILSEGSERIVTISKKIRFFRALGHIVEHGTDSFSLHEDVFFDTDGPMFDVSQGNAVINTATVKSILRRMAVMGLNMIMLYCEDSYSVEGEPYFGYMRGKYTETDMRALDDYADMFGIEMIPCIQTLAHLTDALNWDGIYGDISEDKDCLLVGEDKTYEFIRRLIISASRPFRSNRIHIGMDEAWHLGLGRWRELHGITDSTEIMKIHLERVMKIINELELIPMMWSDMFFRAVCGDYYNADVEIPCEVIDSVPNGMKLIYWDYYHTDSNDFYLKFIDSHRCFGEPIFAGGIWSWMGFGLNWRKTVRTMGYALDACKQKGIREVFVTIWGDNGTECDITANLIGLSFFAEHCYSRCPDEQLLERRFNFTCGANRADFETLQFIDEIPGVEQDNMDSHNPSKFLMWQDVLCGLFDKNIENLPIDEHYRLLAEKFSSMTNRNGEYNCLFEYAYCISDVLSIKSEIGIKLRSAYLAGDKTLLEKYMRETLPELRKKVSALRLCHMENWFSHYKALGWDIMDMRYGSLLTRIDSAVWSIEHYLNGKLETIEELDEPRLSYNGVSKIPAYTNFYGKIVSPSRIAPLA